MKNLCIIPARGGSKRIPRKNIKEFLGKPIIAYSIEAAIQSGIYDEVMVSTEDEEIARIARQYGASVPFMRSEDTANDYATTSDVVNEVLKKYRELNKTFDTITTLYSTAPFVSAEKLKEGMKRLTDDVDGVMTIVQYSYPPQRAVKLEEGYVRMVNPEYKFTRSQDLVPIYHDAGQFYMMRVKNMGESKGLGDGNTVGILLSELEVQDLDNPIDWVLAELKYRLLNR